MPNLQPNCWWKPERTAMSTLPARLLWRPAWRTPSETLVWHDASWVCRINENQDDMKPLRSWTRTNHYSVMNILLRGLPGLWDLAYQERRIDTEDHVDEQVQWNQLWTVTGLQNLSPIFMSNSCIEHVKSSQILCGLGIIPRWETLINQFPITRDQLSIRRPVTFGTAGTFGCLNLETAKLPVELRQVLGHAHANEGLTRVGEEKYHENTDAAQQHRWEEILGIPSPERDEQDHIPNGKPPSKVHQQQQGKRRRDCLHWPLSAVNSHERRKLVDTPNTVNVGFRPQNHQFLRMFQESRQSKNARFFCSLVFLWYSQLVEKRQPWPEEQISNVLPKNQENHKD